MTQITQDASFGPTVSFAFDFTLAFENWFFAVVPPALLVLVTPIYVCHYWPKTVVCENGWQLWAKQIFGLFLLILEIAAGAVWRVSERFPTISGYASITLSCVGAAALLLVVTLTHRKATQSSAVVSVYLGITLLLQISRSRSFFLRSGLNAVGGLSIANVVARCGLLMLEELPKPYIDTSERFNEDITCGFWNRTLLLWINGIMLRGYQKGLKMADLKPVGPESRARVLSDRFDRHWKSANREKSKYALIRACVITLLADFLIPLIARLCLTGFQFTIPQLMQAVLNYIERTELQTTSKAAGLVGATVLVYAGQALATTSYQKMVIDMVLKLRGLLTALLFAKTLKLPHDVAKQGAALTHLSADIDGILQPLREIHNVMVAFLELGLALYFLWTKIGKAFFLPGLVSVLSFYASYFLGRRMGPAMAAWNKSIETRVSKTSTMLSQMKSIKMMGAERVIKKFIQSLRAEEIKRSLAVRRIRIVMVTLFPLDYVFMPALVVAGGLFWTTFVHGLDPATIFPALAIAELLFLPAFTLLTCWPDLGAIAACFSRLQEFLLLEERHDQRQLKDEITPPGSPPTTTAAATVNEKSEVTKLRCMFAIRNASIAADRGGDAILEHLTLSATQQDIIMAIGPVGSGKSMVLRSLLGETAIVDGSIEIVKDSMAFVGHDTWLPSGTVRDVVLGETAYDSQWYASVLNACMLNPDIAQFPKGDQMDIGSNGSVLSGGQRQRIALARAVYSRPSIILLDDVLSALDKSTAAAIFSRLFEPRGLFKASLKSTVILATHSIEYLGFADSVWVFDTSRSVTTEAPEAAMRHAKAQNVTLHASADTIDETSEVAEAQEKEKGSYLKSEVEHLDEMKTETSRGSDFTLYSYLLGPISTFRLILWGITIATVAFMEKMFDIYIRIWVQVAPRNKKYFIGLMLLGVLASIINAVSAWIYMIGIIPKMAAALHDIFIDTVMSATLAFMTETNNGVLLNRASQDMTVVAQELPMALYRFVYTTFLCIAGTVIILTASKYAAIMIPFLLIFLFLLQLFYLRTSRQMRLLDLEARTPLFTQFTETITGLEHIRAFGWQSAMLNQNTRLVDYSQKPFFYLNCIQRWLVVVLDMMGSAVATIVVIIATFVTASTSQASTGLALLGTMSFNLLLANLVRRWTELETSLGAIHRLKSFVTTTPVEQDESVIKKPNWPYAGDISLENVSARYSERGSTAILRNITLTIAAGKRVGIVGRTGSGKSSFLLALLNLMSYEGTISIDNVKISDVPRQQLRSSITTISQDSLNLPGSVRDNVLSYVRLSSDCDVSDDEIEATLRNVEIWDHVEAAGGLDAAFEGVTFSQGQRQLFNIGRAMIHHAKTQSRLVLMDEATSNIDRATDSRLQQVMKKTFENCTVVIVAHRAETIADVDVKITFANGKIDSVVEI